jgi:GR25 family glycosyltransferase involved in LPS biosynthesis
MFLKYFNEKDIDFIELPGLWNQKVLKILWDNLINQKYSENVFLAEDDYIYSEDTFHEALEVLTKWKDVDVVTLYDHIDNYNNSINENLINIPTASYKNYNNCKSNILVTNSRHWRSVKSTCITFLTTRKFLINTRKTMWNNLNIYPRAYDYSFWIALTKIDLFSIKDFLYFKILIKTWICWFFYILFGKKIQIYSPIPSLATHIESTGIAPIINYDEIYHQYQKENENSRHINS